MKHVEYVIRKRTTAGSLRKLTQQCSIYEHTDTIITLVEMSFSRNIYIWSNSISITKASAPSGWLLKNDELI